LVLPFAGFLVSQREMSFLGVFLASTTGVVCGALVIYFIGFKIKEEKARYLFKRYGRYILMSEKDFDRALDYFHRHGGIMVLVGRIIPGMRSLISLPAGVVRMNLGVFLIYTLIGTGIWNAVLIYAGILLEDNWASMLGFLDKYEIAVWGIIGLLIFILLFRRLSGKTRQP
jgi:membrane protein DedA with SNARE-associated domain